MPKFKKALLLPEQSAPGTPATGHAALYTTDGTALLMKDDSGNAITIGPGGGGGATPSVNNASLTSQGPGFAASTYLAGSSCAIPNGKLKAGTKYRCRMSVTKTAAGVATPSIAILIGTNGSALDTQRASVTFPAQTAVTDNGLIEVFATFRSVGSGTSAVLVMVGAMMHDKAFGSTASTGLSVLACPVVNSVGSGFDSTVNGSFIGLVLNAGASAAWTIQMVEAELSNLA